MFMCRITYVLTFPNAVEKPYEKSDIRKVVAHDQNHMVVGLVNDQIQSQYLCIGIVFTIKKYRVNFSFILK